MQKPGSRTSSLLESLLRGVDVARLHEVDVRSALSTHDDTARMSATPTHWWPGQCQGQHPPEAGSLQSGIQKMALCYYVPDGNYEEGDTNIPDCELGRQASLDIPKFLLGYH